jgi:ubiquinone/menaquinone biosynthesis C-methylase UbiE
MFAQPEKNVQQFSVDLGMKVADLGSGAGFYSLALARAVGKNGRVFAVDIQQELLSKLKNEAVKEGVDNIIEVVWGDIDEPKGSTLQDNLVDKVVVSNTLFQVEDKEEVAREAYRILKPKGQVLVVDWEDSFGGLGPQKSRIVSYDQAKALFEKAGFSYIRDVDPGSHHYGLILKK